MDFSLLHMGLAGGALLATIPVLIHLFHRPQPKKIIFPALRLIRERNKRATRSLKIKNWLLLLFRMLLLALMALALARPALNTQTPLGDQEVPTALGLVFDTSLSMAYTDKGKDRLTEAKERALEILAKMPETSQVFVIDSAEPGVPPSISPAAARSRVDGLVLHPANRPLNAAVGQAYAAVSESDRPRHEVYVLTDLARSAWDPGRVVDNRDKTEKVKNGVATYVLQLAPKEPRDVAITEAEPVSPWAVQGDPVEIRVVVRNTGPASRRVVELYLDGKKRAQQVLELPANAQVEAQFQTPGLELGSHFAEVKLSGGTDALTFDDSRGLALEVRAPLRVLICTDLVIDADFLANALDPSTPSPGISRPFRVDRVLPAQRGSRLADASLRDYAAVILNNVESLSDAEWSRLNGYLRGGGGLIIGLGDRTNRDNYNSASAAQILPGTLGDLKIPAEPTHFGQADFAHPLFMMFPRELNEDLSGVPIQRYLDVKPAASSRVLLTYTAGGPALLERAISGQRTGRVLMWTTPLSRRPLADDRGAWNEFPLFWSFVHLQEQAIPYLARSAAERLNYEAGEDVVLPIDPAQRLDSYVVQTADGKLVDRLSPAANAPSLVIMGLPTLGTYTVTGAAAGAVKSTAQIRRFSVNAPVSETVLTPLKPAELDGILGKDRYALADDTDSLKRAVAQVRVGRELFPFLMMLILLLITAENFLANRFYREPVSQSASSSAATRPISREGSAA